MKQNKFSAIYLISIIIAIGIAALEAISYPGFVAKHIFVSAQLFYFLSLIFSLTKYNYSKKIKTGLFIFICSISVLYTVLIFMEKASYPNYVYTITHINLLTLLYLVSFSWFHYLRINNYHILKSMLIASLIYIGADGVGNTLEIMFRELRRITSNPFATYEQKMTIAYPGFYPAMKEVVKLTPPDSTILIPPQGHPWEQEGNGAMVTYFIYPRKAINFIPRNGGQLKSKTYILIANGSWRLKTATDFGWPKISIKSNKIIQIDLVNHNNITYNRSYDPNTDRWDWGLIEVNNE